MLGFVWGQVTIFLSHTNFMYEKWIFSLSVFPNYQKRKGV